MSDYSSIRFGQRRRDAEKVQAVLTSTVCEAVEDVAFIAEALEASGRVDAEMVAGAVKGALVNVCTQTQTHTFRKTPQRTKNGTSLSSFVVTVCCGWLRAECYDAGKKWLLKGRRLLFVTGCSGQPPGVQTLTISRHRNGIFNSFEK